jgi:hypothetical protein
MLRSSTAYWVLGFRALKIVKTYQNYQKDPLVWGGGGVSSMLMCDSNPCNRRENIGNIREVFFITYGFTSYM